MLSGRTLLWLAGLLFASVVVLGFGSLPNAEAQSGAPLSKRLEDIRERMERGQALYTAGQYEAAAKVFEEGYRAHPYAAFLFNAGVCYQKLNRIDDAVAKFEAYLSADSEAPDAAKVRERIAKLKAAKPAQPSPPEAGVAGADAGDDAAAEVGDGGVPESGPTPPVVDVAKDTASMKSLVLIETTPSGAPLRMYSPKSASAAPFRLRGPNPDWQEVVSATSPASLTLDVGRYHIVVEKFRDFNPSDTEINVQPGRVLHYKSDLSQGAFLAGLHVGSNVRGAFIYLDDPGKKKPYWGTAPYDGLVAAGKHKLLIEAPGFEPVIEEITLAQGGQSEVNVRLSRVGFGYLQIDADATEVEIRIDDRLRGTWREGEPPFEIKLPSGPHRVSISADGRKTYEGKLDVPRGQALPVHARMIPKYPRGAAWVEAIVGAVFIGASIYVGLESNRVYDEMKADREAGVLAKDDSRKSKGQLLAIGADAGFAIGGVLAALATYNFLKDPYPDSAAVSDAPREFDDPRKDARPRARRRSAPRYARRRTPSFDFAPSFSPNSAGFSVGGRF